MLSIPTSDPPEDLLDGAVSVLEGPAGFLIGPENRLVEVVVHGLMGRDPAARCLLFYGPSGVGKSLLVRGLAGLFERPDRARSARVLTGKEFVEEWAEAVETQTIDDFRARQRDASLLAVEDLKHLSGHAGTQKELALAIDERVALGLPVVVTAHVSPGRLPDMLARLQSRLVSFLAVPVALPSLATRRKAVDCFSRQMGVELVPSAAALLSESLTTTLAELRGAVLKLSVEALACGRSLVSASEVRALLSSAGGGEPSLHAIASLAARRFSLRVGELRSNSRRREVVVARGVAMYLARQLTGKSLDDIGQYFGGRDHTTVSHGCRTTEVRLRSDVEVRQAVEELQEKLGAK